ncbi:MAG: PhoH family protein [Candidatus Paceibacterota bacterium]|jgi:PhoH-like ATPase
MAKTFILDTNVLLSDPDSLFAFDENEVILPFTTIEELDKIKSRPNEVGANAREVARRLSEMIAGNDAGALKRGLKLRNGGILRIVAVSDFAGQTKLTGDWDVASKDNHILEVCRGLHALALAAGEEAPVLVTRDIVLRVKCDFLGIPCEDYKKNSVAENADRLYVGATTVDVPVEVTQAFWEASEKEGGSGDFNCIINGYTSKELSPNEFVVMKDPHSKEPAVVRYIGEGEPLKIVRESKNSVFNVTPRNREQHLALDLLLDPKIKLVTLIGRAGCGKTLLSIAAGLNQVLEKKKYKSLFVCRPVVPVGNDIGFLPGTKEEKLEPWIAPIKDNLRFLLFSGKKNRNSEVTLQGYFEEGIIEVEAITYLRGRSIANAFIIIDEAQNLTAHELKTIITRVGENTKIILTGDIDQIDNLYIDSLSNGLTIAVEKFKEYSIAGHVTLVKGERSELATLAAKIL